jgi:hypothetical protein
VGWTVEYIRSLDNSLGQCGYVTYGDSIRERYTVKITAVVVGTQDSGVYMELDGSLWIQGGYLLDTDDGPPKRRKE